MQKLGLIAAACLAAGLANAARANAADEDRLRSAHEAAAVIDAAAEALGGRQRLEDAKNIGFAFSGALFWIHQGFIAEESLELKLAAENYLDADAGIAYASYQFTTPNSTFTRTFAFDVGRGGDSVSTLLRYSPHAVVKHFLAHPRDLQVVSKSARETVISGPFYGRTALVTFDNRNKLPAKTAVLNNDSRHGDSVTAVAYLDYAARGDLTVPRRVRETEAGAPSLDAAFGDYTLDAGRPAWSAELAAAPPRPPGASPEVTTNTLAPDVHMLTGHAGPDYNALAVVLEDGVMLLETPQGDAEALKRAIATLTDRPLAFVSATHHHNDHSGGMAAVAGPGVTILTTPGAKEFFEDMVSAPRVFTGGAATESPTPTLRLVGDGERIGPVQFFDVGPSPHAKEHLIFYFPEHRMLFQSDLIRIPAPEQTDVDRPQVCTLYNFIRRNNLNADRIAGGHGAVATFADLEEAVSRRSVPCEPA